MGTQAEIDATVAQFVADLANLVRRLVTETVHARAGTAGRRCV